MIKLILKSGDTWQRAWVITHRSTGQPVDLTGATILLQLRDAITGLLTAAASLSDGRLTVDLLTARVNMLMPASVMALPAESRHVFDFEVTYPSGVVKTYETGRVAITQDNAHE